MPSLATMTAAVGLAVEAGPELDLDARMALVGAVMTERLDVAALAIAVNTAHINTTVDLDDVVRLPAVMPEPLAQPYPTPVAALLQRAACRLETGGWCRGTQVDAEGARCSRGAIQAEASTPAQLSTALTVLLEAIRRQHPGAETVPSWNDVQVDGREPVRLMRQAADLANARAI